MSGGPHRVAPKLHEFFTALGLNVIECFGMTEGARSHEDCPARVKRFVILPRAG